MNDNNNSLQTTADAATMTIAGQSLLHQDTPPLQQRVMVATNDNTLVDGVGPGELVVDDLTLTTELHLSSDELEEINQSAEIQCLLQEHSDTTTFGNNSGYCLTNFDTILCWPRTPRATLAALPCLDEFQGIQYDSSQNATRYCHANGTWDQYTNYDACMHLTEPASVSEFEPIIELPTIIYYVGYTISLVSLTLALMVFAYFKELRCLRNSIHANLFFTYIMSGLLWILTLSVQISLHTGMSGCIVLVTLFHFFTLTNFFWMLVEGLYLYILVVKTFSGDNTRFTVYATIGWGGPAVFVVIWAIAKGLTMSYATNDQIEIEGCPWMQETYVDWIFQGPVCAVLIINLIFLLRIMWVLITKLRSANTLETRQYRKAAKALLVLIPLFGITYLVVLAGPSEAGVMSHMFAIVRAVLLSTQGFSVSLFYCFLNSEVRNALRHHISTWQDERNIRLNQSRRPLTAYYGKGKRESCVSSTTTTTIIGQHHSMSLQRGVGGGGVGGAGGGGSNGALHMMPTATTLTLMPWAVSPLMKDLEENSV
ncbi:diuretic hormone 44 receptor 1 isoform X2 [Musca autumnalis]|uniref:diuretic hormone 44 receptor 1 isoform X2 n=1 Tax=Musca autumnalis TaxID=221902 RepID=UPI003CEF0986